MASILSQVKAYFRLQELFYLLCSQLLSLLYQVSFPRLWISGRQSHDTAHLSFLLSSVVQGSVATTLTHNLGKLFYQHLSPLPTHPLYVQLMILSINFLQKWLNAASCCLYLNSVEGNYGGGIFSKRFWWFSSSTWYYRLHCFSGSECYCFHYKHVYLALRDVLSKAYS